MVPRWATSDPVKTASTPRARRAPVVDLHDPRVRMNRPYDDGVGLAGEIHIVVKTAFAPYEADVLETFDWLTDSELSHGPLVTHVDGAGSRSGNSVALTG